MPNKQPSLMNQPLMERKKETTEETTIGIVTKTIYSVQIARNYNTRRRVVGS